MSFTPLLESVPRLGSKFPLVKEVQSQKASLRGNKATGPLSNDSGAWLDPILLSLSCASTEIHETRERGARRSKLMAGT